MRLISRGSDRYAKPSAEQRRKDDGGLLVALGVVVGGVFFALNLDRTTHVHSRGSHDQRCRVHQHVGAGPVARELVDFAAYEGPRGDGDFVAYHDGIRNLSEDGVAGLAFDAIERTADSSADAGAGGVGDLAIVS